MKKILTQCFIGFIASMSWLCFGAMNASAQQIQEQVPCHGTSETEIPKECPLCAAWESPRSSVFPKVTETKIEPLPKFSAACPPLAWDFFAFTDTVFSSVSEDKSNQNAPLDWWIQRKQTIVLRI